VLVPACPDAEQAASEHAVLPRPVLMCGPAVGAESIVAGR